MSRYLLSWNILIYSISSGGLFVSRFTIILINVIDANYDTAKTIAF